MYYTASDNMTNGFGTSAGRLEFDMFSVEQTQVGEGHHISKCIWYSLGVRAKMPGLNSTIQSFWRQKTRNFP